MCSNSDRACVYVLVRRYEKRLKNKLWAKSLSATSLVLQPTDGQTDRQDRETCLLGSQVEKTRLSEDTHTHTQREREGCNSTAVAAAAPTLGVCHVFHIILAVSSFHLLTLSKIILYQDWTCYAG